MSPQRLREYVAVARDVAVLAAGTFFSVYLPVTHQFEWWQAPLIAGCFGFVLTVPRGSKDDPS